MKIVVMIPTFTKDMGYIGNMLPKYLARLGVEVHVLATDLPHNYYLKDFQRTYDQFLGSRKIKSGTVETYDNYTLHILPHQRVFGQVRMIGWLDKLMEIRPDVVQALPAIGWIPLDAAIGKIILNYQLFTGSHTGFSVFPLAQSQLSPFHPEKIKCFLLRTIPGRLISLMTEKCYCPTEDCLEVAQTFFGVQQHKLEVMYLGVDTDYFFPIQSDSDLKLRKQLRQTLGFESDDILCIYTGKMTDVKNPLILAKAIEKLRSIGENFSGLFIGNGEQKELIAQYPHCKTIEFKPFSELGSYYRASDIGVWPTNESTSMLDAAACGLPLIVSDGIFYRAHVEGNGLVYPMNNLNSLVETLLSLKDYQKRSELGIFGATKMANQFSWESIAKRRLLDYQKSFYIQGKNE